MANEVSKAEFLKRYLQKDKKSKRKHKKKAKSDVSRLKIVDQDINIKSMTFGDKSDEDEDEAPVIAAVIDERPEEIRIKELYDPSRWKKIDSNDSSQESLTVTSKCIGSATGSVSKENDENAHSILRNVKVYCTSDNSPGKENSGAVKRHSDNDISSLSRKNSDRKKEHNTERKRHDSESDISPVKKSRPVNKRRHDSDSDLSPARTSRSKRLDSDSDLSPARASRSKKLDSDSDFSPPRSQNSDHKFREKSVSNPKRGRRDSDSDISPPRANSDKPQKTLSGLKAGLQNAASLRTETQDLKQRESAYINKLDDEISGRNAETILRDRKTGKKRDLSQEKKIKEEQNKIVQEHQKKYVEWGKGVEQTRNQQEKFADDLYEMSKPLARYQDDEDLDRKLKEMIHEEDPMYEYMKKKQKKTVSTMPTYKGPPPPPNRFGIMPGYRWDGVDRSNGFEKKYFEKCNHAKAVEEEAYLWSVQNM